MFSSSRHVCHSAVLQSGHLEARFWCGRTNGSEGGVGQKAGSMTINTAVAAIHMPIPGYLAVCMSKVAVPAARPAV